MNYDSTSLLKKMNCRGDSPPLKQGVELISISGAYRASMRLFSIRYKMCISLTQHFIDGYFLHDNQHGYFSFPSGYFSFPSGYFSFPSGFTVFLLGLQFSFCDSSPLLYIGMDRRGLVPYAETRCCAYSNIGCLSCYQSSLLNGI